MTTKDAEGLACGDTVFWNDPDNGECSRYIEIASIEIVGDVAEICAKDGGYLECYLRELQ
jgi:hypothetical protein